MVICPWFEGRGVSSENEVVGGVFEERERMGAVLPRAKQSQLPTDGREHWVQVVVTARDVEHQEAVVRDVAQIDLDRFPRQEVGRDGVALEGVQHQCVKARVRLNLAMVQLDPGVTDHDANPTRAVCQIREVLLRDSDHLWINLVERD